MKAKIPWPLLVLVLVYAAPIVFYVAVFGLTLSFEHARWAEFGSAMAGIYAPIVAVSTLAVLFIQVTLQKQINDHQYVQAHLQQARDDISFYCTQLPVALEAQLLPGQTVRTVLHTNFQPQTLQDLDAPNLRTLAANIDANSPSALGLWFAIYPILAGLAAGEGKAFEMTLGSSIQKLIAILGFETCVALDNYHRTRSEGRLNVEYKFSPLLAPRRGA